VQSEGLVRANELFSEWLRGEKSMPFGERGEHTPVRLIDFENLSNNDYVVTNQWVYPVKEGGRRFDIVMLVNGIPLVIGEAKTPVRPAVTWVDGASDIHNGYEQSVPQMFVPNVLSFATEGKCYRYGSVRMPIDIWGPWHEGENKAEGDACGRAASIRSMLRPHVVLDILQNFTLFATDKKHRRIKIICRYQQYEGANLMVARVVKGYPKKGLIWHFQGSGKSLLMVFAAQKLRMHRKLGNPTVMIVVDRIDLDTQITATFNAADIPNMIGAPTPGRNCKACWRTCPQDHHHHHPQVRRGGRPPERALEHHRDGGRGAPHPGRRSGPQDARRAAQRLSLWPDRHADQQAGPQHLLGLRRGRG
jgi:type I restriction enzyme, R subunit